jgi:hypothetical protein
LGGKSPFPEEGNISKCHLGEKIFEKGKMTRGKRNRKMIH